MRFKQLYATALALLALGACGLGAQKAASKVLVDTYQTDVIFGAGQPSPVLPPQQALQSLEQPSLGLFEGNNFELPPIVEEACATAPSTSFPAVEATSDVTRLPANGDYRWTGSGSWDYSPIPAVTLKMPITQFYDVIVRHAATTTAQSIPTLPGSAAPFNFTYETIQPANTLGSPASGFYDLHWQVHANPQLGDPEGGLALKEIDLLDNKGKNPQPVFIGQPALLLLPLPAQPGAVGTQGPNGGNGPTVSADTSGKGNNMQFSGSVGPRERVDACGEWLQAWPVDGTLQSGPTSTATIHMDVATQQGALVIAFNITGDGSFLGTKFHKLGEHIATTKPPAAVPSEFR